MSPVVSAAADVAAALIGQPQHHHSSQLTSNFFFASGTTAVTATAAVAANGFQPIEEQSSSALSSAFTLSSPPLASSFSSSSSSSSSYHLPSSLTLALFTSPATTEPSTLSSSTSFSSSTVSGGGSSSSFTSSTSALFFEAAAKASSSMHLHHPSTHHHHSSSSSSANITSSMFTLAATTANSLTTAQLSAASGETTRALFTTYHRDSPLSLAASSVLLLNESSLLFEDGGVGGDDSTLFDNLDASLSLSLNRGILMAIILGAISLFTIVGNLMVIWAIFNYRPLHNVQNMFMVSLAVADIAVAVLVMPLNVAYNLTGRWMFGLHLCEMWLTSDVLCCTASILNLCAIALDRYWAIHDPINYAQKRTMRRVCTSIGAVWILSAIISIPPLIGWNDWPEYFDEDTPCKLSEEKSYLIYSSSGSFYIPLLIMTVVYFKIFKATRRRLKARAKASAMANLGRTGAAGAAGAVGGGQLANTTTISTANLNTAAATTTIVNHKDHITKSSSNDDSSSSGSPTAVHGSKFDNFKSRCIRCCRSSGNSNGNGSKTGDKTDKRNGGKNSGGSGSSKAFRKGKHQGSLMMNREARIEIESASDDLDHSHNEGSSSDAANEGGEVEALVASCPPTNGGQFGGSGGGCGSLVNELATRVPGGGGGLDDTAGSCRPCPCNSTAAAPAISNGQQHQHQQHCSASVNNGNIDCNGSNGSSSAAPLPSLLHQNGGGTFCSVHHPGSAALLPTSASTGSASAALFSQQQQIAYVCSCSSSGGKTASALAQNCCSEEAAPAGQEDERTQREKDPAKTTQVELAGSPSDQKPFTAAGEGVQRNSNEINGLVKSSNSSNNNNCDKSGGGHICIPSVNSPVSLLSPTATTSTTLVPYQTGSIASVSNMSRPELSSSNAITTTAMSCLSKTIINIPSTSANSSTPTAPGQTISVKKMWEERQKISLSRERRATRILGIVMGVFVACWAPFFIYYLKPLICDSCSMPHEVENFITWLGYINSALNPLIYCGFNRDFRRAFQRILSCKKV